jgi:ribosomal protein L9
MKVLLLRDARIKHYAGEIVEVSPAEMNFLVGVGSAVELAVKAPVVEVATKEPEVETKTEVKKTRTKKK